eukprot:scaffold174788_cov53-Prasinocladus_malaysianus.AAC.1
MKCNERKGIERKGRQKAIWERTPIMVARAGSSHFIESTHCSVMRFQDERRVFRCDFASLQSRQRCQSGSQSAVCLKTTSSKAYPKTLLACKHIICGSLYKQGVQPNFSSQLVSRSRS